MEGERLTCELQVGSAHAPPLLLSIITMSDTAHSGLILLSRAVLGRQNRFEYRLCVRVILEKLPPPTALAVLVVLLVLLGLGSPHLLAFTQGELRAVKDLLDTRCPYLGLRKGSVNHNKQD